MYLHACYKWVKNYHTWMLIIEILCSARAEVLLIMEPYSQPPMSHFGFP